VESIGDFGEQTALQVANFAALAVEELSDADVEEAYTLKVGGRGKAPRAAGPPFPWQWARLSDGTVAFTGWSFRDEATGRENLEQHAKKEKVSIDWEYGMRQWKRRTVKQWRAAKAADLAAPEAPRNRQTSSVLNHSEYKSFYALSSDGQCDQVLRWNAERGIFETEENTAPEEAAVEAGAMNKRRKKEKVDR